MFCGGFKKHSNRLIGERSPYLLQHSRNPVDWYPWGEEAFERARAEEKPVFLSVGYFACHWCHVMAKESFEDDDVAELLNESFVSIKVDREERPDIDALYMRACQVMTGAGGWPLTIVMTPDRKPFFAATYIPKRNAYGRVGLLELLPRIRDMWRGKRPELLASAEQLTGALEDRVQQRGDAILGDDIVRACFEELRASFDRKCGGFGGAPKFPSAHHLMFLMRYYWRFGDPLALAMVEKTLAGMRMGGIHDHVGGGFHRYATDAAWRLPHFEKMLYDQALISLACVEAWQLLGKPYLRSLAESTLDYAIRDLQSPNGGFMCSEGADSPEGEGAFYAWRMKDLKLALDADEIKMFELVFGVRPEGNVEGFPGSGDPANILCMKSPLEEVAASVALNPDDFTERVNRALMKLFDARNERQRPVRDDKVLADWNGLMIAALATAARAFGNAGFLEAARWAADDVLRRMKGEGGRLVHSLRDAQEPVGAFADDYACMIWGLIELYQACFDVRYLSAAIELNERLMADYFDEASGVFIASAETLDLPVRMRESFDGAQPSANSIQIRNLSMLSRVTGEASHDRQAWKIVEAFGTAVRAAPSGHTAFLSSLMGLTGKPIDVIVAGSLEGGDAMSMLSALRRPFVPDMLVLFRDGSDAGDIDRVSSFVKECKPLDGKATAYICKGRTCLPPTTDREEALAAMVSR
jgi:hypothetical protein